MSVNKRLLEQKSNQELEKYIEIGNRFVPQANLYAYEILKSRGREFTDEESERIMSLINKNNKNSETIIHKNHKKSSDLIYLSGALGIGNLIWTYETLDNGMKIFIALFSLAFVFGIGYLVSKGTEWIKYVLLVILILGLLGFPFIIANLKNEPVVGIINIVQTVLQIWALVLLFKIPQLEKQ
ncbi:hypothetical protein ASG01_15475 [Chryseobacterium sp. Leaf180]|uniref:hypothetical protein n=1 Tax=Chryseobacterium sp. Leaf180 TaxID=1736289 RepID=UPI0006F9A61A|nr:hypothetical protein [Chryseobacterium sp. Leaf180]KQR94182.1 hypothetical protein ASG01_15475 [Chryseobacterium sp. Leaf180]